MSGFSIFVKDKNNLPVIKLDVWLFEICDSTAKDSNISGWMVSSELIKIDYLFEVFGDPCCKMSKIVEKNDTISGDQNWEIKNASADEAYDIVSEFAKTIGENLELIEGLYIKWPEPENMDHFRAVFLKKNILNYCKNAHLVNFNKYLFTLENNYKEALAWEIILNNFLFDIFFDEEGILKLSDNGIIALKCNLVFEKLAETSEIDYLKYYKGLSKENVEIENIEVDENNRFYLIYDDSCPEQSKIFIRKCCDVIQEIFFAFDEEFERLFRSILYERFKSV